LADASDSQLDLMGSLKRNEDMFAEIAEETAKDMLERFAREENGIFELEKRLKLPVSARNKAFLTRQNTSTHGFIVWLHDTETSSWQDMDPQAIVPEDIEVDDPNSRKRARAVKEINDTARNMLAKVVASIMLFQLSYVLLHRSKTALSTSIKT